MVLGLFPGRGILLIWITVGQIHIVLAASADGVFRHFFSYLSFFFSFSLSMGGGPI